MEHCELMWFNSENVQFYLNCAQIVIHLLFIYFPALEKQRIWFVWFLLQFSLLVNQRACNKLWLTVRVEWSVNNWTLKSDMMFSARNTFYGMRFLSLFLICCCITLLKYNYSIATISKLDNFLTSFLELSN